MAKNFRYLTRQHICIDRCTYITRLIQTAVQIGSIKCSECDYCKDYNWKEKVLSCTKIIYRNQITGEVVMRKPNP